MISETNKTLATNRRGGNDTQHWTTKRIGRRVSSELSIFIPTGRWNGLMELCDWRGRINRNGGLWIDLLGSLKHWGRLDGTSQTGRLSEYFLVGDVPNKRGVFWRTAASVNNNRETRERKKEKNYMERKKKRWWTVDELGDTRVTA